ncbi:MAG TPA: helix-turn-helix domain-containing protein [Caulobacteraceae bacterium]|nr:helix-turn-helix domain-containing protein [Caulobacteraceae bacterium]
MSKVEAVGWATALEQELDAARAAFVTGLVALATGVQPKAIATETRARKAVTARQIAIYLASTQFGWPLWRVGTAFGRDRTTAALACRRIEERREDAAFDAFLSTLERCLRAAPEPRAYP